MRQKRHRARIVATLGLVSLAAGTAGWKAAPAAGAPGAAAPTSDVSRLSPEAARMYAAVRNPRPGELGWQQIPWGVDLQQGIQRAREEGRPLLLFVSGDDPLEKC